MSNHPPICMCLTQKPHNMNFQLIKTYELSMYFIKNLLNVEQRVIKPPVIGHHFHNLLQMVQADELIKY